MNLPASLESVHPREIPSLARYLKDFASEFTYFVKCKLKGSEIIPRNYREEVFTLRENLINKLNPKDLLNEDSLIDLDKVKLIIDVDILFLNLSSGANIPLDEVKRVLTVSEATFKNLIENISRDEDLGKDRVVQFAETSARIFSDLSDFGQKYEQVLRLFSFKLSDNTTVKAYSSKVRKNVEDLGDLFQNLDKLKRGKSPLVGSLETAIIRAMQMNLVSVELGRSRFRIEWKESGNPPEITIEQSYIWEYTFKEGKLRMAYRKDNTFEDPFITKDVINGELRKWPAFVETSLSKIRLLPLIPTSQSSSGSLIFEGSSLLLGKYQDRNLELYGFTNVAKGLENLISGLKDYLVGTFHHELGHFFLSECMNVNNLLEYYSLVQKNGVKLPGLEQTTYSPEGLIEEDFTVNVALFKTYPETLRANSKERYEYFTKLFRNAA